jgi:TFIIF-interacting CTD phosphatase-like protein
MQEFMQYLKENKKTIETILYTSGQEDYTNHLLNIIDPKREVFDVVLYQPACYVFEKKDEDILMMIKDITRFKNRDMSKAVLLDPKSTNFILSPENGIPVMAYSAEMDMVGEKDPYLLALIDELKDLAKMDDVRPYIVMTYQIRNLLKNSKLI